MLQYEIFINDCKYYPIYIVPNNIILGSIDFQVNLFSKQVICELVETERAYVDNLSSMIKLYFQPLQEESFLSKTEVLSLFGNIQDIYSFQQRFLQSLEDAIDGDLDSLNTSMQLKVKMINC